MFEAVLPFPDIDPVLIRIGPLAIRWYALAYIAGLLLGWWYILRLLKRKELWVGAPFKGKPPATADNIGDLFVWVTLGVIIGGRLGYVLFYGILYCGAAGQDVPACAGLPEAFYENPLKIFAAWEGGMSFHGGLVGVILGIILFCRRNKLPLLTIADLVAAATPIGLFFGRVANFINSELWGRPTDVPWAVVFPNAPPFGVPRHPSQLYEAFLEGIVLFVILRIAILRFQMHRRPGMIIALFLGFYGLFRFIAEFFRDSESKIYGWFSMGQALSLPMWFAAAFFLWYALQKREPKTAK